MEVAVAGMKNVGDTQFDGCGHAVDFSEHLRQRGAGNDAVLNNVVGRDAAHGGESGFAAFPNQRALGVGLCDANFGRAILPQIARTSAVNDTNVSTGAVICNISGFSAPINLDQSGALSDILDSISTITATGTSNALTFQLDPSGGISVDGIYLPTTTSHPTLTGGSGNDTFLMGNSMTAADQINGGGGTNTVVLNGDYSTQLGFASTTMVNIQDIVLTKGFAYDLKIASTTVAAGHTLTINGSALAATDQLVLDGSASSGRLVMIGGAGSDTLTGGAGSNTFESGGGHDTLTCGSGSKSVCLYDRGAIELARPEYCGDPRL